MPVRLLLLTLALLALGFAPAPLPKQSRPTLAPLLKQMQGWWVITYEVVNGNKATLITLRLHVEGDTLQYYAHESKIDGWKIRVDPSTSPPGLDMTRLDTTEDVRLGRVTVDDDGMRIAWLSSIERPDDVSGRRGHAFALVRQRE